MNEEELNRLLEKYYNGESTEEEERSLRDYFSSDNIPEGFDAEKVIFGFYLSTEKIPEPSHGFENRILTGIDALEAKKGYQKIRKYILLSLSTAAGLFILAGSYFFFINRTEPPDTFSNPEIAYVETMKILMDVSSQMNNGAMALEPVGKISEMKTKSIETINKSTALIEKNLKNLDYLKQTIEVSDSINSK
jgi:hypothetical protein